MTKIEALVCIAQTLLRMRYPQETIRMHITDTVRECWPLVDANENEIRAAIVELARRYTSVEA